MATALQGNENPRKLKILISLLYYFPHRTGLTIHVQHVAEELVRRGHEVTVLTARYSKSLPREDVMHNGVRVVRLWAPLRISRGMVMPAYPLAMYLFMRQYDVVSIHTPMLETAIVALLSMLTGCNVVITHHGDLVLPEGKINRLICCAMFAMYKTVARQASAIIGYSHDYARNSYYLRSYLDKTQIIYPPIKIPCPQPERVTELRKRWQHEGGPIIGYPGRFVLEKRPDVLIQALDVINQAYPNARIVFAGQYDIPYESTWERLQPIVQKYREQLIFLGLIEDEQEMANFMAACDVLAMPSDTECFALVQVEGMLCGTPFVMSDIPGARVPIAKTGMGKLAKRGDACSVGRAIVDILNDPEKFRRSYEEIREQFSLKETVDRYERIFLKHARRRDG